MYEGGVVSPIDDVEYAAIKTIHKQLDDNADGTVDLSESAEVSEWTRQSGMLGYEPGSNSVVWSMGVGRVSVGYSTAM